MKSARREIIRTFVAIKLPEEVKDLLKAVQSSLDRGFNGVSWVRPDSIHLTLKFLGEIDDGKVREAALSLGKAPIGIGPFMIEIEGVGAFPNARNPRVVWVGIKENVQLLSLQRAVETHLQSIGFEAEERPFTPHLTLCRIKSPADGRALGRLITETKPEAKAAFTVTSFAFMKSTLKPTGAVYTPIQEFALEAQ